MKQLEEVWNETGDKILAVFAHFLWTLKFIFLISRELFPVLLQATI